MELLIKVLLVALVIYLDAKLLLIEKEYSEVNNGRD